MEAFKIEHFEREHGRPFPTFRKLSHGEAEALQCTLKVALGLAAATTAEELLRRIHELLVPVETVNAGEAGFDIKPIVSKLALLPTSNVLINWDAFETVDEMRLIDFADFFDDIWYPAADDIEVFASDGSAALAISHSGSVSTLRFSTT